MGRAQFLGVWRLVSGVGTAGGPLLVSGVGAVTSLGAASVAVGATGFVGAALVVLRVPEPLHRSTPVRDVRPARATT